MFKFTLTPTLWLRLSPEERRKLKEIFNIPKSSYVNIVDNQVISDGHIAQDLEAITVEKMQAYTGSSKTNFVELFQVTLDKLHNRLINPKRGGRPPGSKNKKYGEFNKTSQAKSEETSTATNEKTIARAVAP